MLVSRDIKYISCTGKNADISVCTLVVNVTLLPRVWIR